MNTHFVPVLRRVLILCLMLLTMCVHHASADAVYDNLSLEEIMNLEIDTVTKTAVELAQAPSPITVITHQEIKRSPAKTIPELLRQVSGVNVRWNPMMQTIDIRGFGQNPFTNRVLLLIDGVPYNSWNKGGFPQQPGFDFFPLENVKRIEVMKGPGSAIYGENAYWGVINIKTLSGADLNGTEISAYTGPRNTKSFRVSTGGLVGDGAYFISAKKQTSQMPVDLYNSADRDIRSTDYFARFDWQNLTFSAYRHSDDMEGLIYDLNSQQYSGILMIDPPIPFTFETAPEITQDVNIYALDYNKEIPSQNMRIAGNLSYADRFGSHCASCHDPYSQSSHSGHGQGALLGPADDHGSQKAAELLAEFNIFQKHRIVLGVDYRTVDSGNHAAELADGVDQYEKAGVYIQDQISTEDDKYHFTFGLRQDLKTSPDLFDTYTSPRFALVHQPNDRLTVRTGWNLAYHYPDFSTLYQNTNFFVIQSDEFPAALDVFSEAGFPLAVFVENPDLKPEEIRNVDLGFEYLFNEHLHAKVDFYRSVVKNFIVNIAVLGQEAAPFQYVNHPDDAIIWGADIDFKLRINHQLGGFINYSLQHETQRGDLQDAAGRTFEFVYAPRHKINVGMQYGQRSGFNASATLLWKDTVIAPEFWSNVVQLSEPEVLKGYTFFNLKLAYTFQLNTPDGYLDLFLEGKDLFNEAPTETRIGFNTELPGREIFGGVELRLDY